MHVHSSPDLVPRKTDDIELAHAAKEAGMGGILLKAHHGSTVDRAYLVQQMVPDINVFGTVTLNYPIGGLNPQAVEACLRMGGKEVWMPTLSAKNQIEFNERKGHTRPMTPFDSGRPGPWVRNGQGISILDESGGLLDAIWEILEIVAEAEAILGTGHLSVGEIRALAQAAKEKGVKRLLITHPELPVVRMELEDQLFLARLGAFFERCLICTTPIGENLPMEVLSKNIRATGVDSNILSSDYGQVMNEHPVKAMEGYLEKIHQVGFNVGELERMTVAVPKSLLGL